MYTAKGPISITTESAALMVFVFLINLGLVALAIMVIGWLLHIGWNWI